MSDKRTVHTDALETLGTIIGEDEKRDAIHLAVAPVVARETLRPGQNVTADGYGRGNFVGIVDPFLVNSVSAGERFWLVIYPRKINSLRHVWSHPAFPDEGAAPAEFTKEQAEQRLRVITESWDGPSYGEFIEIVTNGESGHYSMEGDHIYSYGVDASGEIPSEVWDLAEVITGRKIASRPQWFSCSC